MNTDLHQLVSTEIRYVDATGRVHKDPPDSDYRMEVRKLYNVSSVMTWTVWEVQ